MLPYAFHTQVAPMHVTLDDLEELIANLRHATSISADFILDTKGKSKF
jgi:hypothetical protein